MKLSTVTNDPNDTPPASGGCLRIGLFVVLTLWIVVLLALSTPIIWLVRDVAVIEGLEWPWYVEPLIVLVQAGLVGLPAGLFAFFVRAPRLRAAGLAWFLAALALAAFGLTRGLPPFWYQATLLAQALLGLGGAFTLRLAIRKQSGVMDNGAANRAISSAMAGWRGAGLVARYAAGGCCRSGCRSADRGAAGVHLAADAARTLGRAPNRHRL